MRDAFLKLVRLGTGHQTDDVLPQAVDWSAIKTLADKQGLSAIVLDGISAMRQKSLSPVLSSREGTDNNLPSQEMLLEWIGEVMQEYEQRYKLYEQAISEMAAFYNSHGYKMMVLKGYACSLDWPKPEHRPCGDIDIWQFGKQKEADALLAKEKDVKIDFSHHHHTVFSWGDFMVENHYDFINVHHHKSHVALEKKFKELAQDDSFFVKVYEEKVYLPSPNLHALFLLKHAALHFVGTELTFRQVLDWAFFVQKHGNNVDWEWLLNVADEHGMLPFFHIMNAICVEDLRFKQSIFPTYSCDSKLKERVMNEIFSYVYEDDVTSNFFMRQANRFRRWKANEWKHKLCYNESMWSSFWSGVWSHLLKPASI